MTRLRRPLRRSGLARIMLAGSGLLLVIAAGLLRFVIVPGTVQLPAHIDTTVFMSGRLTTLDAQALARGDIRRAVVRDAASSIEWRVKSVGAEGDAELLAHTRILTIPPSPQEVAHVETTYALNRKTLYGTTDITGPGITNPVGLTTRFPIPTEQRDYLGWVNDTQRATMLAFRGEEEHDGLLTYHFVAAVQALPITNQQVLDQLPVALPKAELPAVAALLGASAQVQGQIETALPTLPDTLHPSYSYTEHTDFWVEPTTGVVVDLSRREIRSVVLPLPDRPQLAVYDQRYAPTPASVAAQRDEAADGRDEIMLLGSTAPLVLAISGVLMIATAAWLVLRARRQHADTGAAGEASDTGLPPSGPPPEDEDPPGGRATAGRP